MRGSASPVVSRYTRACVRPISKGAHRRARRFSVSTQGIHRHTGCDTLCLTHQHTSPPPNHCTNHHPEARLCTPCARRAWCKASCATAPYARRDIAVQQKQSRSHTPHRRPTRSSAPAPPARPHASCARPSCWAPHRRRPALYCVCCPEGTY